MLQSCPRIFVEGACATGGMLSDVYSRLVMVHLLCAQLDFVEEPAFHFFVGYEYRGETEAPTIEKRQFCTNMQTTEARWGKPQAP